MRYHQVMEENIRRFGEYRALFFEGREFTNQELYSEANRVAGGLRALGLEPGEAVVTHMSNCPEVAQVYGACRLNSMVVCPTVFLLAEDEMRYIISHSEARAVVTSPPFLEKIRGAVEGLQHVKYIIVAEGAGTDGGMDLEGIKSGQPARIEPAAGSDRDPCVLIYTSGTTGRPKGVMLSESNLYSNAVSMISSAGIDRDEVALSALPLSHSFGLTVGNGSYISGNFGIIQRWFNPQEVLELTERFKVTSMAGVPTMYALLAAHPEAEKYDTGSWRRLVVGASPCPRELHAAFFERFGIELMEGYGLSEASPIVAFNRPGMPVKKGSVGPAIEGVEVRIVDEEGGPVEQGDIGEVTVRGPNVMLGYYKDPGATAEAIRDGWLFTGDMGRQDQDGYLFLVERKKDLIIRGGFNIYPKEVEEVLVTHPAVEDAVAVGRPNPVLGEEVVAFVVLRPGQEAGGEEIAAFTRGHLADYKVPVEIRILDELPRNVLGKVLRKELRGLL